MGGISGISTSVLAHLFVFLRGRGAGWAILKIQFRGGEPAYRAHIESLGNTPVLKVPQRICVEPGVPGLGNLREDEGPHCILFARFPGLTDEPRVHFIALVALSCDSGPKILGGRFDDRTLDLRFRRSTRLPDHSRMICGVYLLGPCGSPKQTRYSAITFLVDRKSTR